ncbi:hypothetical protein [Streptomyces nigrescens]|uniref:hypothetical protein n=1 Tax=Streptomyces nigrescens TaxID=1920 RepID=UPI0034966ABF
MLGGAGPAGHLRPGRDARAHGPAPLGGALGGRLLASYGPGALPVAAACCTPAALLLFAAAGRRRTRPVPPRQGALASSVRPPQR